MPHRLRRRRSAATPPPISSGVQLPVVERGVLGLPDDIQACLFDLDGVLTKTAAVHAAAWKQMFDDFLRKTADTTGARFTPVRHP